MPELPITEFVQANTNGKIHDAREKTVSSLNRSFLYGDSVYEVWRTYNKVVFAWDEHIARLENSARAVYLEFDWSPEELWGEISQTVAAFRRRTGVETDVYIRLQIYRGEGAIGLDSRLASEPGFVIWVKPVPTLSAAQLQKGAALVVANSIRRNAVRTLDPAWKTGNYLNNIIGLREAKARGGDDVVFLNLAGELTEASTSNIAFIEGNRLVTPPPAAGILCGITRGEILRGVAATAGLEPTEASIRPEDLGEFDEAILLSTTKDIQPVARIDDCSFATGESTRSRRLKDAFADHASAYAARHPHLAV